MMMRFKPTFAGNVNRQSTGLRQCYGPADAYGRQYLVEGRATRVEGKGRAALLRRRFGSAVGHAAACPYQFQSCGWLGQPSLPQIRLARTLAHRIADALGGYRKHSTFNSPGAPNPAPAGEGGSTFNSVINHKERKEHREQSSREACSNY
jgi:hypothetical protein